MQDIPVDLNEFVRRAQVNTRFAERYINQHSEAVRAWCQDQLFSGDAQKVFKVFQFFEELGWDHKSFVQDYGLPRRVYPLLQEGRAVEDADLQGSVEFCIYHFYDVYSEKNQPLIVEDNSEVFREYFFKPLLNDLLDHLIQVEPHRFSEFMRDCYLGLDEGTSVRFSDGYFFEAWTRYLNLGVEKGVTDWSGLLLKTAEVCYMQDAWGQCAQRPEILRACVLIQQTVERGFCSSEKLPLLFWYLCSVLKSLQESFSDPAVFKAVVPVLRAVLRHSTEFSERSEEYEFFLQTILKGLASTPDFVDGFQLVKEILTKSTPKYMEDLLDFNADGGEPALLMLYSGFRNELRSGNTGYYSVIFDYLIKRFSAEAYQDLLSKISEPEEGWSSMVSGLRSNHLAIEYLRTFCICRRADAVSPSSFEGSVFNEAGNEQTDFCSIDVVMRPTR